MCSSDLTSEQTGSDTGQTGGEDGTAEDCPEGEDCSPAGGSGDQGTMLTVAFVVLAVMVAALVRSQRAEQALLEEARLVFEEEEPPA